MSDNRYIRQTLLDKIGESGQQNLLSAHVAIVGCGGLGSIAGPYLAGAGIGRLTLIDGDVPDLSNLHRQVFFSDSQSKTKAELLADHIQTLNPTIEVEAKPEMITKDKIDSLLSNADVVLECTDNINVKYLVNDFCHMENTPMVYGAIHKYDGFVSFFENQSKDSIHLRDIFPEPNFDIPSCSEVGVLGTLAGLIGLMQANEAIKYISKAGKPLIGTMLSYDILTNDQMKLKLKKSWYSDIQDLYKASKYTNVITCDIPEVTLSEVLKNRSDYDLISILDDHEHKDIDDKVIHQPLSNIDIGSWKPFSSKQQVYYCMSGKRSGVLVAKINSQYKNAKALSLKGGVVNV